jgi:hypothetical protein
MSEIEAKLKSIELKIMTRILEIRPDAVRVEQAAPVALSENEDNGHTLASTARNTFLSRLYRRLWHWS